MQFSAFGLFQTTFGKVSFLMNEILVLDGECDLRSPFYVFDYQSQTIQYHNTYL